MNTLRLLQYAHFNPLFKSENYVERLYRIKKIIIVFSRTLEDEILFYNGWVGYGKE